MINNLTMMVYLAEADNMTHRVGNGKVGNTYSCYVVDGSRRFVGLSPRSGKQ